MTGQLPALAVLDWGIGGFGCVAALQARLPDLRYVYVSDSGFAPYGRVSTADLARRLGAIGQHLHDRGVRHLVIACNAASTVVDRVRWPAGLQVTDVLSCGLRQVLADPARHIGIVGGRRTILAQSWAKPLRQAGRTVSQRIGQPLSAHIERGDLATPALHRDLQRIVGPLRAVPVLVLACTHYPAIAPAFAALLPAVRLLDPIAALVEHVLAQGPVPTADPAVRVFTTGDPAATRLAAWRAFGVVLPEVEPLPLPMS